MSLHISKHTNPKGPWKLSTCRGYLAQEVISHCFTHCLYSFVLVVKYEKIYVSVTTPGIEFIKPWDAWLPKRPKDYNVQPHAPLGKGGVESKHYKSV